MVSSRAHPAPFACARVGPGLRAPCNRLCPFGIANDLHTCPTKYRRQHGLTSSTAYCLLTPALHKSSAFYPSYPSYPSYTSHAHLSNGRTALHCHLNFGLDVSPVRYGRLGDTCGKPRTGEGPLALDFGDPMPLPPPPPAPPCCAACSAACSASICRRCSRRSSSPACGPSVDQDLAYIIDVRIIVHAEGDQWLRGRCGGVAGTAGVLVA